MWPHSTVPALCRVEHLQRRHDLAGGEDLDLELAFRQLADAFAHVLDARRGWCRGSSASSWPCASGCWDWLRDGGAATAPAITPAAAASRNLRRFMYGSPFGCDDLHLDWRSCLFSRGGRGTRQRPGKLCAILMKSCRASQTHRAADSSALHGSCCSARAAQGARRRRRRRPARRRAPPGSRSPRTRAACRTCLARSG